MSKARPLFYRKRELMCVIFLMHSMAAIAQTLPDRRYTTRDGLVADRITAITQDEKGFMWIGSLFGISRYDGTRFTTLKLPALQQHKYVTSLLAADGKVYAGFLFGGGLMEYDKGKVTTHLIHADKHPSNNDLTALFEDPRGIIAINTANEAFLFQNGAFQYLFTSDSTKGDIFSIASGAGGRVWVGTTKGLHILQDGILLKTPHAPGAVLSIQKLPDGIMVIWVKAGRTHFTFIDKNLQEKLIWKSGTIHPIRFAGVQSNSFWGVDNVKGLFNLTVNGQVNYYASSLESDTEIKYLFADRENNLWIATDPGVLKIANMPAISYQFDELAPGGSDVCIGEDSVVWCSNSKFLYRVVNNRLRKVQEFRGKEGGYLGAMAIDHNNYLWICGWKPGIWKVRYNEDKLVFKQFFTEYQKQEINVNCITGDESGNLWAAGNNGIFHIRDGEITGHFQPLKKDGSPMFITSIAVDGRRKELWVGDNNAGLARISFAPVNNTFSYRLVKYFGTAEGLTDTHIRSLNFDSRSNLWIGTRLGGIFRLRQKSESAFTFDQYNTSHGIPCTRVTDIAEEKDTAVWFATCDGVLRFSLSDETWNTYGVGDGLLGSEIFSLSVDSRNHHLWAVSGQGVTDLNYNKHGNNRPPPPVNITQVSILGQEDPTALLLSTTKKLEADENSIGFSFAGSSYTDEKKVRYRYMLEGYDKTWSGPVQSNNVNYASLPFGFYTFKVQASNGERWSEQPATFSFQIIRPFYRSFWFIALISCLVAGSIYFFRVYRLKQKLKLERLRVNIARDLHDDIGSALGSINLLSENAMRRMTSNRSVEDVSGVFQKIGHSAQSMLDSMDDIIWTINPEKDSLDDLIIRMREFAIPLLEAKNISFDINMKAAEGIKPSMEIRRNVYLIFKEAIFNIMRHSECTKVSIHAYFNSRTFELTITDNGKGFNANGRTGRNGIRNMQKRATISGASLEIDSAPSKGTSIRFHGIIK